MSEDKNKFVYIPYNNYERGGAEKLGDGTYKLLNKPELVDGFSVGDIVRVVDCHLQHINSTEQLDVETTVETEEEVTPGATPEEVSSVMAEELSSLTEQLSPEEVSPTKHAVSVDKIYNGHILFDLIDSLVYEDLKASECDVEVGIQAEASFKTGLTSYEIESETTYTVYPCSNLITLARKQLVPHHLKRIAEEGCLLIMSARLLYTRRAGKITLVMVSDCVQRTDLLSDVTHVG